eukprot:TRINITY_DN16583_c0_g1_i1.p1 TRINITY_DN16583_c0_g1~~TRINITY_DN16583_c0_g1_i1.p1  ORF type:complete len:121 (+),score=19.72 TRINITY_DN16583_c0_g1_i1:177-539(+)
MYTVAVVVVVAAAHCCQGGWYGNVLVEVMVEGKPIQTCCQVAAAFVRRLCVVRYFDSVDQNCEHVPLDVVEEDVITESGSSRHKSKTQVAAVPSRSQLNNKRSNSNNPPTSKSKFELTCQ